MGLKPVAAAGGFKGETLTSLQHCFNFKNTHYLLIEVREAHNLEILDKFLLESIEVNSTLHEVLSMFDPVDLPSTRQRCLKPLQQLHKLFIHFTTSKEGLNWKLGSHFVKSTCFSYIALFCAIRSGNWDLRLAGIKSIIPVFTAFDRPTYRKELPQHLADLSFATGTYIRRSEAGRVQC